jgi:6-phosphogluconolactonase
MRRAVLSVFILACALAAFAAAAGAPDNYIVYVGSYTDAPSTSKGIRAWRFEPATGHITSIGLVAETINPAYVIATPDRRFLYATNWQTPDAAKVDTVSAYAINAATGALTFLNKAPSGGGLPNEVVVDPRGKFVAVTNFGFHDNDLAHNNSAFAALKILPDGKLAPPFLVDHYAGPGSSPQQSAGAHTHGVVFTKDDRFAFVAELGLDRVYSYHVDADKPSLTPLDPPYVSTNAGAGPRRLVLSANDKFLYLNHQDDSKVSVFAVDNGHLKEIQQLPTLPADYKGRNTTAEIQLDKSGRFLYVSNRGGDNIAVYAVDSATGKLTTKEFIPALGKSPRNITVDPTGQYLFAANQNSNNLVIFKLDGATGHLTPLGTPIATDQPGSVLFVREGK